MQTRVVFTDALMSFSFRWGVGALCGRAVVQTSALRPEKTELVVRKALIIKLPAFELDAFGIWMVCAVKRDPDLLLF